MQLSLPRQTRSTELVLTQCWYLHCQHRSFGLHVGEAFHSQGGGTQRQMLTRSGAGITTRTGAWEIFNRLSGQNIRNNSENNVLQYKTSPPNYDLSTGVPNKVTTEWTMI